jgi:hypothetical protein
MFGIFRKIKKAPEPARQYLLPAQLNDEQLVSQIQGAFVGQKPVVGALFLVAFVNLNVYYTVFQNQMQQSPEYPPNLDGMAAFTLDQLAHHQSDSLEDQVNRRRWFYFYIAVLLTTLHSRARANASLWNSTAEIWALLMDGAQALRETLDRTSLWKPSETEFFANVLNGSDGERYVETLMIPKEIRYHQRLKEWYEKDLPEDVKAELRLAEKRLRGD